MAMATAWLASVSPTKKVKLTSTVESTDDISSTNSFVGFNNLPVESARMIFLQESVVGQPFPYQSAYQWTWRSWESLEQFNNRIKKQAVTSLHFLKSYLQPDEMGLVQRQIRIYLERAKFISACMTESQQTEYIPPLTESNYFMRTGWMDGTVWAANIVASSSVRALIEQQTRIIPNYFGSVVKAIGVNHNYDRSNPFALLNANMQAIFLASDTTPRLKINLIRYTSLDVSIKWPSEKDSGASSSSGSGSGELQDNFLATQIARLLRHAEQMKPEGQRLDNLRLYIVRFGISIHSLAQMRQYIGALRDINMEPVDNIQILPRDLLVHLDSDHASLDHVLRFIGSNDRLLTADRGRFALSIRHTSCIHSLTTTNLIKNLVARDEPLRPQTILRLGYLHSSAMAPLIHTGAITLVPSAIHGGNSTDPLKFVVDDEPELEDFVRLLETAPPLGIRLRLLIRSDKRAYRSDAFRRLNGLRMAIDSVICIGKSSATAQECDDKGSIRDSEHSQQSVRVFRSSNWLLK